MLARSVLVYSTPIMLANDALFSLSSANAHGFLHLNGSELLGFLTDAAEFFDGDVIGIATSLDVSR